ncbi:winged helix-turn-helix transcriptional regulator [Streptomyces sp. NBC_01716]|uniref:winged helix-turn-helix transcriptional regulator n=1 Tax=Streptomyces sp. NBC_01716 TaxID=2975917 RepID=UPI002E31AA9A|nr:winged helix-turn-helix transcriptional regulator [Streptomyces sp. NBC_01716]
MSVKSPERVRAGGAPRTPVPVGGSSTPRKYSPGTAFPQGALLWAALAIGALEEGPQRFGALQRRLQGVSPKVLTSTLRRLADLDEMRTLEPGLSPVTE